MKNWDLVRIEWFDAIDGEPGWQDIDKIKALELPRVIDVGWKIHEDDKKVILMASFLDDIEGDVGGRYIAIPKSWINKVTKLA